MAEVDRIFWYDKEGKCKATWKREFKLQWREAGPPNHLDDEVESDLDRNPADALLSHSHEPHSLQVFEVSGLGFRV